MRSANTTVAYFEDLFIGQRFRSPAVEVTEDDVLRFASENDPQFFHVDEKSAAESVFGGLVASGWQTASLSLRLLLEASWPRFADGAIGADAQISWKRPVRPGDRLRIDGAITGLTPSRSRADRGYVNFGMTTFNQDDAAVLIVSSTILVLRDPKRRSIATIERD